MKKSDLEIVGLQGCGALARCDAVNEYMVKNPFSATFDCIWTIFYLGYIAGKRDERKRRKAGTTNADA